MTDDDGFAAMVAAHAARVPGVVAVTLGGSRPQGLDRPDSDWDFGLYYRGRLDPRDVRALGWEGEVFAPGDWGGGVMNGGAWLSVEGRRVDLHYRDLDEVAHWTAEAERGRFEIQRLLFYAAGIPTYVLAAELALSHVLLGDLPRPAYPEPLRHSAHRRWTDEARLTLNYVDRAYAIHGAVVGSAALLAQAVLQAAHARLAARGVWVLNEKRMVEQAGLGGLHPVLADLGSSPEQLHARVATARTLLDEAMA